MAADLKTGIYVEFDDGTYTEYVQSAADDVTETIFDGAGDAEIFETRYGIFQVSFARSSAGKIDPSSLATIGYLSDIPTRDELVPGFAWTSGVEIDFEDPSIASQSLVYSISVADADDFTGAGEIMIGECFYEAIIINHSFASTDGLTEMSALYIPELNVSVIEELNRSGVGQADLPAVDFLSNVAPYR